MKAYAYNGRKYLWHSHGWMDLSQAAVEVSLSLELDRSLRRSKKSIKQIAKIRRETREQGQRSMLFASGIPDPENAMSVAVYAGIYRELGEPLKAVRLTDRWKHSQNPYILTARSTALCDLRRWNEAQSAIYKAIDCGGGYPALVVLKRIHDNTGSEPSLRCSQPTARTDREM